MGNAAPAGPVGDLGRPGRDHRRGHGGRRAGCDITDRRRAVAHADRYGGARRHGIAGKGHEQGQEFEDGRKEPFDDVTVVREALGGARMIDLRRRRVAAAAGRAGRRRSGARQPPGHHRLARAATGDLFVGLPGAAPAAASSQPRRSTPAPRRSRARARRRRRGSRGRQRWALRLQRGRGHSRRRPADGPARRWRAPGAAAGSEGLRRHRLRPARPARRTSSPRCCAPADHARLARELEHPDRPAADDPRGRARRPAALVLEMAMRGEGQIAELVAVRAGCGRDRERGAGPPGAAREAASGWRPRRRS